MSTDQICAAIQDIFQDTRSIAEPAGALAVAGIKKYVAREHCSGHDRERALHGACNQPDHQGRHASRIRPSQEKNNHTANPNLRG